jgi:hypothetical protein
MKKLTAPALAAALLLSTLCLYAADFWAKPYTEWSDKDIQKMLSNSPWAKQVPLSVGAASGGERSGKGGRGGSNGRPGSMGETGGGGGPAMGGSNSTPGISSEPGSAGRGGDQMEQMGGGGGGQVLTVTMIWQSALLVKQAIVRRKYGSEAATSEEAKKYLEREDPNYVILMGLPGGMGRGAEMGRLKDALKENTSLNVKGKDPIKATQVEFQNGMAIFGFPKTNPITLDDKEVEFSTKLGATVVKQKFDLKHMAVNGKLEL